jgi:hypothetical protein
MASAQAAAAVSLTAKILRALSATGKAAVPVTTSVVAGVTTAKALKELEHAHDDSPMVLVITYYALLSHKEIAGAKACWENPPDIHFAASKSIDKFVVNDIKEINKTPSNAAVLVEVTGSLVGQAPEKYKGPIYLKWASNKWLITSMKLVKD